MKYFFTLFILIVFKFTAFGQQVILSGKITNNNNEPAPFASVYIKGSSVATSANEEGFYQLKLKPGKYTLIVQAIGYKSSNTDVEITANKTTNVKLDDEVYELGSVEIKGNGEDPAYAIMRKSIAKRKEHFDEIKGFRADVYIKGVQKLVEAPKKFLGRDVAKILELDSNRQGILYLSESESKFYYEKPNNIKEEMLSSKVAGRNNAFSFNKASDLQINFYNNFQQFEGLSNRGFISPVADNALFYYRYKLLGSTVENGQTINKIKVIPRRTYDPVFRGDIYITEDSWRIYSTNLILDKSANINFVDTLKINQQYIPTGDTWMPSNVNFNFSGKVLGFAFEGYFIGIYSNYDVNPKFEKNFFSGEILSVKKGVNKKDSLYWYTNRPVPLVPDEIKEYKKRDSLEQRKLSKTYLDSLERENNKFKPFGYLIAGHTFNDRYNKQSLRFNALLPSVFYNTVEGYGIYYGINYTKNYDLNRSFSIEPNIRVGFQTGNFRGDIKVTYNYNPVKNAFVSFSAGSIITDLNNFGTISQIGNTFNTLLYETNFLKLYKKNFAAVNFGQELANGLYLKAGLEYARRFSLNNQFSNIWRDIEDEFLTSNNPFTPTFDSSLFPANNAFTLSADLSYAFGAKFITRPDGKFYEPQRFPKLSVRYRKGLNFLGSDVNYDFAEAELSQDNIKLGLLGRSSFSIAAGKFFNDKQSFYVDYRHFRGNQALTFNPSLQNFHFLDYYTFSTTRQFIEAHYENNFYGFLFNKIPFLRKAKLEEIVGAAYLTQPDKTDYTEVYIGIKRLIFRVDYGFSFDRNGRITQGFKIFYGF